MGKYTELKRILLSLQMHLEWRKSIYKKIEKRDAIDRNLDSMMFNKTSPLGSPRTMTRKIYDELTKLKEYKFDYIQITFTEEKMRVENVDEIIEKMNQYDMSYQKEGIDKFDFRSFLDYLKTLPEAIIETGLVKEFQEYCYESNVLTNSKNKDSDINRVVDKSKRIILTHRIDCILHALASSLASSVSFRNSLENEQVLNDVLSDSPQNMGIYESNSKKFNRMLSDDEVLIDFSDEDLKVLGEIIDLAKNIIPKLRVDETYRDYIVDTISKDQRLKEERLEQEKAKAQDEKDASAKKRAITFDNLDMSKFTSEEQSVINVIREIVSSVEVGTKTYENVSLTTEERFKAYEKESLKNILSDVSCLLSHIYDDKDMVIAIFKGIIKKYVDFVKKEHIKELGQINSISSALVSKISRECFAIDYENSTRGIELLTKVHGDIDDYLPMAENELEEEGFSEYDEAIASQIAIDKENISLVIRGLRLKEFDFETSNLVFNLSDSKITDSDFISEYKKAIPNLEYRKLYDMRMLSTGSSLYPLRTETEDFVTYIKRITGRRPRFVPCIYSGLGNIKTVIMEFNPSRVVREHLEKKYSVLNDGNYYGVYGMISDSEIKRNGYNNLAEELVKRFSDIQKIGEIFTNEKPTDAELNYLDSVIENGLRIKEKIRVNSFDVQK